MSLSERTDVHPESSTASWHSLVERSVAAWENLTLLKEKGIDPELHPDIGAEFLQSCDSLEDFLQKASTGMKFWFFFRRDVFLAQTAMSKWSPDRLDDYVLLPIMPDYVSRADCFFMSHFWRSKNDPDPGGECLRHCQNDLKSQDWLYIWIDWTCLPQEPRTPVEEYFFVRSLNLVALLIQNCGFVWSYPPFEPRMWILYEVAEFVLTCDRGPFTYTDNEIFMHHIMEMFESGVHQVLDKYNYKCTHETDKAFLASRLELLILMSKLGIDMDVTRELTDLMTRHSNVGVILVPVSGLGILHLLRFEGTLIINDQKWHFTPFAKPPKEIEPSDRQGQATVDVKSKPPKRSTDFRLRIVAVILDLLILYFVWTKLSYLYRNFF